MTQTKFFLTTALITLIFLTGCQPKTETSSTPQPQNESTPANTESQTGNDSTAFTGSITDLFKRSENVTCNFSSTDQTSNASTTGTIYLASDQKMRGDFTTTTTEGTFTSHVINDSEYMYSWGDQLPQGMKMKAIDPEAVNNDQPTPDSPSHGVDLNQEFTYDCSSWTVDQSKFTPPSNIQFQDFTQQMEQLQKSSQGFEHLKCNACQQLSGDQKTQCLQAMGC